jgi:hypothetical protein
LRPTTTAKGSEVPSGMIVNVKMRERRAGRTAYAVGAPCVEDWRATVGKRSIRVDQSNTTGAAHAGDSAASRMQPAGALARGTRG